MARNFANGTLAEACDAFIDRRSREPKPPTVKQIAQYRSQLSVLKEACGPDTRLSTIKRAQARKLFEALTCLPPGAAQHPALAGLSVFDAAQESRRLRLKPMSPKTVNNYFTLYRSIFKHESRFGSLKENPFALMSIRTAKTGGEDRAFTEEELQLILSAPIFMGCRGRSRPFDTGTFLLDDWRFWAPLIAVTSGARIGEIAQLRPEDVSEVNGVWVFDFNDDGLKKLKAAASRRKVPVHDELLRLGLLSLRDRQRSSGNSSLLGISPRLNGNAGAGPGNWLRERFLPKVLSTKRAGTGFHAFRHAWITAARQAGVTREIRDRLSGHQSPGVSTSYGSYPVGHLKAELDRISLPAEIRAIPPRPSPFSSKKIKK